MCAVRSILSFVEHGGKYIQDHVCAVYERGRVFEDAFVRECTRACAAELSRRIAMLLCLA